MCHIRNENWKKTNIEGNRTARSRKIQNNWKRIKLQVRRDIGIGHYYIRGKEGKNRNWVSHSNEKSSRNQYLRQKSHQRDINLGFSLDKILRTILNMDKRETQKNRSDDKNVDDDALGFTFERCKRKEKKWLARIEENRSQCTYRETRILH